MKPHKLNAGYYALHEANAKGCLQCFCYGITGECRAAELGVEVNNLGPET